MYDTILEGEDYTASLLNGLTAAQKTIPSRFFYDAHGSALFEHITEQPEYYPTRAEAEILKTHGPAIADTLKTLATIVEFGSGSSIKTEILLRHLPRLNSYVAIDVSASALNDAKRRLEKNFPNLLIKTIVADFSHRIALPPSVQESEKAGFFPGSTIGNFSPNDAASLLQTFSATLGTGSRLIVGVDLKKPADILNRAYNDAQGVTAEFNLNLLRRANSEASANFDLDAFRHHAAYDPQTGGVDMYLVSTKRQTVSIADQTILFSKNEPIHTEHSHKYSLREFQGVAQQGGWRIEEVWTDDADLFALVDLVSQG